MRPEDIPVYVTCRDRVRDLPALIGWLEAAGQENITLVDMDSTYPPLLSYYEETPHTVLYARRNFGHTGLWALGLDLSEPFILTDPDIVPTGPPDGVSHLVEVSNRYPERVKWGFGLTIEGVASHAYDMIWERGLWSPERELEPGVFDAPVDTTFALYNPRCGYALAPAIRTGPPYVARHEPWFREEPDEEDRYYIERASGSSTWAEHLKGRQ